MTENKKFEKKAIALTDEELDHVAGGMVNQLGIVENGNKDMLGKAEPMKPMSQKSNPFPQNCN